MKKIILYPVFLSLFYLPVFSQQNSQLQFIKPVICEDINPFNLVKSFDFTTFLNDSVYNKKFYIPKIPNKQLFFDQTHVWKLNPSVFCNYSRNTNYFKLIEVFPIPETPDPGIRDQYPLLIKE